ncbi:GntR family transcriptional regulator [Paractinoplanes globisporus]|uniref:GntR family transcriptional regulator n=1 Tax=Paractinoplanes globisporus TaxID=113565 RepID=A0ABW6WJM5_9ACTN|nr:GntR family transcriptional regulator [Actinoplanes globisporus]
MPEIKVVLPKYLQIAADLRDRILRGDLAPGAEVDSERKIAADWKVARPTATKALEALRREGLIESRQGSGTRVRDVRAHRRAAHRYHRYRAQGAQYAPDESMEILRTGIVAAPDHVAEALGLEQPAEAMTRRRLISRVNLGPAEIATSWWPASLADNAPRLLEPVSLGGIGSVRYVESVTGRIASYAKDRVAARLATSDEADLLGLPASGAAVLVYRHSVFGTDDQIIEYAESVYPPDMWSVEQEYPIEA